MTAPAAARTRFAAGPTRVEAGPGASDGLAAQLGGRRAALVADPLVLELHGARVAAALAGAVAPVLPRGEDAKRWAVLGTLLEALAEAGLERDAVVVAFGGGATCDVAGLAAALYQRGIAWIAVPTTLLAQADACLGGKTAVDLDCGKNLAGAFHHPEAVVADPAFLATLPPREVTSGLGEVLKVALGLDEALLAALERDAEVARAGDEAVLGALALACLRAKARVVALDERDRGVRATLNLGHTLGHAIEHVAGYGRVPHGVAVAAGLGLALDLARELGVLEQRELPARVRALAERLGLPADLAELEASEGVALDRALLLAAMGRDKKARGGRARFVLPQAAGHVAVGIDVAPEVLAAALARRGR